jgi:hypothetical protein
MRRRDDDKPNKNLRKLGQWEHEKSGMIVEYFIEHTTFKCTVLEEKLEAPDVNVLKHQAFDRLEHWMKMEWFPVIDVTCAEESSRSRYYDNDEREDEGQASITIKATRFWLSRSPAGRVVQCDYDVEPEHRKAKLEKYGGTDIQLTRLPLAAPFKFKGEDAECKNGGRWLMDYDEHVWDTERASDMYGEFEKENPHKKIHYASKGGSNGDYHLTGLSPGELTAFDAALIGSSWVRVKDGRMQFAHAFEDPPAPEKDPDIGPYWPHTGWGKDGIKRRIGHKVRLFRIDDPGFSEAGLHICHIGAGNRDEGAYDANADRLEKWGFECLRSRRGKDGKFWEVWYLPSLFFAEAELAEAIAKVEKKGGEPGYPHDKGFNKRRLDAAVQFLCRHANFGTLDAFIQRAALSFDD